ncbi:Neurogenic locus notch-like protein [Giardia muris]|uniref:Neurogenic locus notch-like protein n=1 Tax=Giardia muris TaxID=5742 RepID=A0A4Z1T332_GIAMU|nr:Neurogenic locus notch-like protein [Giardia muris]|eukprot:TNJ27457.1 Neurogenic locus notch-like protein [Giardia muris]
MQCLTIISIALSIDVLCPPGHTPVLGGCLPGECIFDGLECGGRGSCVSWYKDTYRCECDPGTVGGTIDCVPESCWSVGRQSSCPGGICTQTTAQSFECICPEGEIITDRCSSLECVDMHGRSCNGVGSCLGVGHEPPCHCPRFYTGRHCEECDSAAVKLHGECVPRACVVGDIGEADICGGHGFCILAGESYQCICDREYTFFPGKGCVASQCLQDGLLCSSHGTCSNGRCDCVWGWSGSLCEISTPECEEGWVIEGGCYPTSCIYGGRVCNGLGVCIEGECSCFSSATLVSSSPGRCEPNRCLRDGKVCPNGSCTYFSTTIGYECVCNPGFSLIEETCVPEICASGTASICSGVGTCDPEVGCLCPFPRTGLQCEFCGSEGVILSGVCQARACITALLETGPLICGGLGECQQDGCQCQSSALVAAPYTCYTPDCLSDARSICSGHGVCTNAGCLCEKGYIGATCETRPCPSNQLYVSGLCYSEACVFHGTVCGGFGDCVNDVCVCANDALLIAGQCAPGSCLDSQNLICQNGQCISDGSSWSCRCNPGFRMHLGACISEECFIQGHGVCYDEHGYCTQSALMEWECACYTQYTGTNCSVCASDAVLLADRCLPSKCVTKFFDGTELECGGVGHCVPSSLTPGDYVCACDPMAIHLNNTCIHSSCLGLNSLVCNGNGECKGTECECYEGYAGRLCDYHGEESCPEGTIFIDQDCVPITCVYDGTVCAGHGMCVEASCLCDPGFTLSNSGCHPSNCVSMDGRVCPNGSCVKKYEKYYCECPPDYSPVGRACYPSVCVTHDGTVCHGHRGRCEYVPHLQDFRCHCLDGYAGRTCAICAPTALPNGTECIPEVCISFHGDAVTGLSPIICGGVGTCQQGFDGQSACICDPQAVPTRNRQCADPECVEDGIACNNHGYCSNHVCYCDSGHYGTLCDREVIRCPLGFQFVELLSGCLPMQCVLDRTECGGHGKCVGESVHAFCLCDSGYLLHHAQKCIPPSCIVHGEVCPNGRCTGSLSDGCVCQRGYAKVKGGCIATSCISNVNLDSDSDSTITICGGHGTCQDDGTCLCDALHVGPTCLECGNHGILLGDECVAQDCVDMGILGHRSVCTGYGSCLFQNASYACDCFGPTIQSALGHCIASACFTENNTVCSGNGDCVAGHCVCRPNVLGSVCEFDMRFGTK